MKKLYLLIFLTLIIQQSQSQSCIELTTYGSTAVFDSTCTSLPYDGLNENLIIPVKFHVSNNNTQADVSKIGLLLLLANIQFSANEVPIEFKNVQTIANHNSINVDYCQFDPNSGDCDCSIFGGTSYYDVLNISSQHTEVLNIFVFENLYFEKDTSDVPCTVTSDDYSLSDGNAYYPNTILPPNGANNYLLIENSVLNSTTGTVLAHELGHLLGLYHTFESSVFLGNTCNGYDGIEDTGDQSNNCFDDDSASTVSCNLMDYGGLNIPPWNGCPGIWNITSCQKSKILDVVYTCRNNLCTSPIQPDVQLTNGLSAFQLNYVRGDQLDTLISVLDNTTGTNSGNFASLKLKDENGLIIDSWFIDSLDLNTVFNGMNHPNHGTFTIEAIDSSLYNPNCKSGPTIIDIFIDPCNNDSVCDSEEECSDCSDCVIDLNNGLVAYYPFNGNANDESGNGHDPTTVNASLTVDRFGNANSAYSFNGIDEYITITEDVASFGIVDDNHHTLSIWVKPITLANAQNPIIADYDQYGSSNTDGDCCDDNFDFSLDIWNGKFRHIIRRQNITNQAVTNITPQLNRWYHIIQTKDQDSIYLYVDNVLIESTETPNFNYLGTARLMLATYNIDYTTPPYFNGIMDDIRIYDRVLKCNEIDSLFSEGCIKYKLVANQIFSKDTSLFASDLIELDNVSIIAPFELILKSPEVLIVNNCEVFQGAKLTVINEDGCIQN